MQHTPLPAFDITPAERSGSPAEKGEPLEPSAEGSKRFAGPVWAYRLLWLTFILFFTCTGLGKLWDRIWHLTHVFDTFFSSPPHVFMSLATATVGLLIATMALSPRFRAYFGPFVRVPGFNIDVAGSLFLLGGGITALSFSVMLDLGWHSLFGLDETQWSLAHDMIVLSWCTVILGFVSCRLAFREAHPINWFTKLVLALLILGFLCPAILGPFYLNYSPDLLRALASVPVALVQPSLQHTYRIYLTAQLSRQVSPLFIPLATFLAGVALSLLRGLDPRARVFLLAPLLWSLIFMLRDWSTVWFLHYHGLTHLSQLPHVLLQEPSLWVPLPLLAAALLYTIFARLGMSEVWNGLVTGMIFAALVFLVWHNSLLMLLLIIPAAPIMLAGLAIGRHIFHMLEKPTFSGVMRYLLISLVQVPAVLGAIDLILRRLIP